MTADERQPPLADGVYRRGRPRGLGGAAPARYNAAENRITRAGRGPARRPGGPPACSRHPEGEEETMSATAVQPEKREFKTELKQLLHIITHSLYSNREIFLRELISNASDAINKIRFNSLQHEELVEDNKYWKIVITPDKAAKTLTISDNGIGMSREGVIDQLGTIAKSGTRAFLENLQRQEVRERPELIGQFGVGFYSAFMVADKVTVVSRTV